MLGIGGMQLTFLGAAGTLTGSKYLLEADGTCLLIDCGRLVRFDAHVPEHQESVDLA